MTMTSNRQIDQIGEKLREGNKLTKDEYQNLIQWRNSFSPTMDYYHKKLKEIIHEDSRIAVAKRIKRIESIKIKLERFRTMRLSTLQDIAGLRVILKDKEKLERAAIAIRNAENTNKIKRLDDYHARPKEDGYRGIHFVLQSSKSRTIEIQLRTELEHIWATAVEVYGTLQKVSFKTGEGHEDWGEFFKYLSSYLALQEFSPCLKEHEKLNEKKIIKKIKKYILNLHVIERLNAVANNTETIINKRGKGRSGKYALLELDYKSNITCIEIFPKKEIDKAIEEYTKKELSFKEGDGRNIVFVNIESIEKLQVAYPNYFLDTKKLLKILATIVLKNSIHN